MFLRHSLGNVERLDRKIFLQGFCERYYAWVLSQEKVVLSVTSMSQILCLLWFYFITNSYSFLIQNLSLPILKVAVKHP